MSWRETTARVLSDIMEKGKNEIDKEGANYRSLFKKILTYPTKIVATFLLSPFLLIGVVFSSESTFFRKIIAFLGLVMASIMSYLLAGFGIWLIGIIIKEYLGYLSLIGYIFSVFFTTWIGVLVQVAIFNFISTVTLKISQKQVLDYLRTLRDGED